MAASFLFLAQAHPGAQAAVDEKRGVDVRHRAGLFGQFIERASAVEFSRGDHLLHGVHGALSVVA